MNHAQFAEHTEYFTINGVNYSVTANFVSNLIFIKGPCYFNKMPMNQYLDFEGTMEEFATSIVENK